MEMMYLIVRLAQAAVVIPQTYPVEECNKIVIMLNAQYGKEGLCIPAPKSQVSPVLRDLFTGKCKKLNDMAIECPAGSSQ